MIKLLNSAMMPETGNYYLREITAKNFSDILNKNKTNFESYIGYKSTAKVIEEVTGISVEISREQTNLADGDVLLICKLKYRPKASSMKNNRNKQNELSKEDFQFYTCQYEKP